MRGVLKTGAWNAVMLMWPRAAALGSKVAATVYMGLSHCVVS